MILNRIKRRVDRDRRILCRGYDCAGCLRRLAGI